MERVKTDVRAVLQKAGEATAKQLAKATGHSETEVINALNALRIYAEVECAQGGRGKGMTYWLTSSSREVSDTNVVEKAKSLDMDAIHHKPMPTDKACCNAAKVIATTAGSHVDELIKKFQAAEGRIAELEADKSFREGVIADLNAKLGHARIQIDALNEQLMAGDDAVDVAEAAKGYLVCAPKRKPAKLMKAESAVARAKSAAKAAGRCEVFALVPVGVATRKRLMAVEFKERAA